MKISSIRQLKNLKNKIVFLRVDFNVAMQKGKIEDDSKIRLSLETINYLLEKKVKLIIATHLGEPKGKPEKDLSTKPLAVRLQKLLKKPVKFLPLTVGQDVSQAVKKLEVGGIVLLENLRFNQGELNNNLVFAKQLAGLADIYVNDAFAVSHRDQASLSAIKKYLPSYAGLLLEKEVRALNKILKPKKPLVVIMGGAKISNYSKGPIISQLYSPASHILLGGALANNFFKYQKLEIGRSLFDKESLVYIKNLYKGKKLAEKIILPCDVVVKTKTGQARVRRPQVVEKTDTILDIGPATIALYAQYIKTAKTLIWNGPLGKFEESSFKHGTLAVARLVAAHAGGPAYGVVGGGETIEALKLTKMTEYVDWVSTAGGAMLTYLGGGKMPGLKGIIKN